MNASYLILDPGFYIMYLIASAVASLKPEHTHAPWEHQHMLPL